MKLKPAPNLERLRKHLHYNKTTGLFTSRKTGNLVGFIRNDRYWNILFEGVTYLGHRLAWYYVHGEWPIEIDHKDKNRSNTAIKNLRKCTRKENIGNGLGWAKKKKSGLPRGVFYHPADKKRFRAQIYINYKAVHLGVFNTIEAASSAYKIAAREHFGEFAV